MYDNVSCSCLVTQSRLTLYDPLNCSSPPGSSVQGIFQARILEWVATSSSKGSSWPRDWTHISCVSCTAGRFFTTEPPGKPRKLQIQYREVLVASLSVSSSFLPAQVHCRNQEADIGTTHRQYSDFTSFTYTHVYMFLCVYVCLDLFNHCHSQRYRTDQSLQTSPSCFTWALPCFILNSCTSFLENMSLKTCYI